MNATVNATVETNVNTTVNATVNATVICAANTVNTSGRYCLRPFSASQVPKARIGQRQRRPNRHDIHRNPFAVCCTHALQILEIRVGKSLQY